MTGEGPMGARRAGALLHVTSLPGGTLGDEAFAFVDFLADAGCTVWQVLPLVPPHEDDGSPYNALSAMAGNPGLIDRSRPVAPGDGSDVAARSGARRRPAGWSRTSSSWPCASCSSGPHGRPGNRACATATPTGWPRCWPSAAVDSTR